MSHLHNIFSIKILPHKSSAPLSIFLFFIFISGTIVYMYVWTINLKENSRIWTGREQLIWSISSPLFQSIVFISSFLKTQTVVFQFPENLVENHHSPWKSEGFACFDLLQYWHACKLRKHSGYERRTAGFHRIFSKLQKSFDSMITNNEKHGSKYLCQKTCLHRLICRCLDTRVLFKCT